MIWGGDSHAQFKEKDNMFPVGCHSPTVRGRQESYSIILRMSEDLFNVAFFSAFLYDRTAS